MASPSPGASLPSPRPAVAAMIDEVIAIRRDVHQHAELSTEEHRTQALIIEWLARAGLDDVRPIADTGVTGIVRGVKPGPNLMWRADIDGLPLREETGLPFASETGVMHACGHDGHVAIALGMAALLQASWHTLAGTVRFAFQPAEEHVGGARRMIDAGIMESPKVARVFGLHIWADTPVGEVGIGPGAVFAAATHFRIIIRGRGGHASAPQQAVDPIVVAAQAVVALQTVVSRGVSPGETAVLTIGRIEGGVRGNVIPDQVMMSGTIRTFDDVVDRHIVERVEEILAGVTAAWGATYRFDHSTLPACVNDAECAAIVERAAVGLVGAERVGEFRTTGADDMAYLLQVAPGAYFFLGGGNEAAGIVHPHHSAQFDFDEGCLPLGIELGLRIVEEATGSKVSARAGLPIVIADYDPEWAARFERERALIAEVAGGAIVAIEHVGSTAVPGLAAKPIIDLMPGVRSLTDAAGIIGPLAAIGYEYVPEYERDLPGIGAGMPERRYFRKNEDGGRAFHMHVVETGSEFWSKHLLFRDYLREHPDAAREYAALKRRLADEYNARTTPATSLDAGYTDRKTDFIESVLAKVRAAAARSAG